MELDQPDFRKPTEPKVASPGPGENKVMSASDKARETRAKKKQSAEDAREDQEIIALAIKRFKRATEAESDNRSKALEDLKFKNGEQWPPDVKAQRVMDQRPCLTVNTIPTFTHQVENDIRQNRPGINISPTGLKASKESAEIYTGIIRSIERKSAAEIAYDTAVISAIDIGFGYFRILTEFEDEKSFDQCIVIRRVRNPFTVNLDPDRQEPDGCDSKWGFVSEMIDRAEFKEKWPTATETPWTERSVGETLKYWITRDQIRVAEYFVMNHEMKTLVMLDNGHIGYEDELDDSVKEDIKSGKLVEENRREVEVQKVMWYRLTSQEVLERKEWVGKWIPIIEVLGDEIDIEGRVSRFGVIRNAKDPARMKNYWATAKAEFVALQPKAPYMGPEGSFDGHENEWKVSNVRSFPYIEYVPVVLENGTIAPAPTRQPAPMVPQGYVEAEQAAQQDVMRTTGIRFDASLSERVYDESGKALHELRGLNDIGSSHYADNLKRSLRHCGRMLLDLIPKIYNKQRMESILNEDGTDGMVRIDPSASQALGKVNLGPSVPPLKVFNPKIGDYEVTVTVGPSYATRRIEAEQQIMKLMDTLARSSPQGAAVLAPLLAKYADWPGSNEAYKALLATLPPELQQVEIQNLPPQAQSLIASMKKQIGVANVEKQKMLKDLSDQTADRALTKEKIDRDFEAKLTKIASDIQKEMMKVHAQMNDQVKELTAAVQQMEKAYAANSSMADASANMADKILKS